METPTIAKFPRRPERGPDGAALLYPGLPEYRGIAALYNTPRGEIVVLAPTLEALNEQVRHYDIGGEIVRDRCCVITMERLSSPNVEVRHGGSNDGKP